MNKNHWRGFTFWFWKNIRNKPQMSDLNDKWRNREWSRWNTIHTKMTFSDRFAIKLWWDRKSNPIFYENLSNILEWLLNWNIIFRFDWATNLKISHSSKTQSRFVDWRNQMRFPLNFSILCKCERDALFYTSTRALVDSTHNQTTYKWRCFSNQHAV